MGADEIEEYLTYLALKRNVGASTQNRALSELVFRARTRSRWTLRGPDKRSHVCLQLPDGLSLGSLRQGNTHPETGGSLE
jgi:hypothetical protein